MGVIGGWMDGRGRSLVWLVLGLVLAACAGVAEPVAERELPTAVGAAATVPSPALAAAPATAAPSLAESLADLGPAPDFTNQVWLNSEEPLNLAALRGKVVLLEFWTFG